MSSKLREQIYKNLSTKDTDELLDIWQTNDRTEWSDLAFEVVEKLLKERNAEFPSQNEPVFEPMETEEELHEDELEDWESKLLDAEDQPVLYDVVEVLILRDNINKLANIAVGVYVLIGLFNIPWLSSILRGGASFSDFTDFGIQFLITVLPLGVLVAVIYFPLKALTNILRILMEIEFRSRGALNK